MNHIDDAIGAAWQARREGRHDDAEHALRQAIDAARQSGSRIQLIRALKGLAHVVRDADRGELALPLYEEAVALGREEGDVLLLAHTVRHLADLHRETGRLSEADRCYSEALSLYRTMVAPPQLDFANALRPAALLKERLGDSRGARALWSEAHAFYQAAGVQRGIDECATHLTRLR